MGYIANNCKEPHSSPDVSAAGSAMLDGYRARDPQLHAHGAKTNKGRLGRRQGSFVAVFDQVSGRIINYVFLDCL